MSDFVYVAIACGWFFVVGYWVGERTQRKRTNPYLYDFAKDAMEQAAKLRWEGRIIGSGIRVTSEKVWDIEPIGCFKVTIEEQRS